MTLEFFYFFFYCGIVQTLQLDLLEAISKGLYFTCLQWLEKLLAGCIKCTSYSQSLSSHFNMSLGDTEEISWILKPSSQFSLLWTS